MKKLLIVFIFLYFCLIGLDFYGQITLSVMIKYISVILCLFNAFHILKLSKDRTDSYYLFLGLSLTAIADLCLLILNFFKTGVFIFCFVQIIYSFRYLKHARKKLLFFYSISIPLVVFSNFVYFYIAGNFQTLNLIASVYALCLLTSLTSSYLAYNARVYHRSNGILIMTAMIFFALCDINVGLSNFMEMYLYPTQFINSLIHFSRLAIWIFYMPSQVMLSYSSFEFNKY